jgi:hypothetical protein
MTIKKKSLVGTPTSKPKEAGATRDRKSGAEPEEPAKSIPAKKLALAKLATAKLSTARLTVLRKLT